MSKILVVGNLNLETTVPVEAFPLAYQATATFVPFGIHSRVSGVGYNIAKALAGLGRPVTLASLIGPDLPAALIRATLAQNGLSDRFVLSAARATPQSVVLYDAAGERRILADLKDVPELTYPPDLFTQALAGCALAVLTNVAYTRPLLALARQRQVPIVTDVHTLADLHDPYHQSFLQHATLLFMSGAELPAAPEVWAQRILETYPAEVVVIGLGAQGAQLAVRAPHINRRFPAVTLRPVVSTGGAGDALLAAFVHAYLLHSDPVAALQKALVFAAHKIGAAGSAEGFLDCASLERLAAQIYPGAGSPA